MRAITQQELSRLTRAELHALQSRIAAELAILPEASHELRIAHVNLHNIRAVLARLEFRPR